MPTFGKSNARAPKKAAAGRKPRTSSADKAAAKAGFPKGAGNGRAGSNFKPKEDGRGGRSEFRASNTDAPRAPRAKGAFFEARAPKQYGDSGRPSYGNRDDRAPREDRGGFRGRDDRAPRGDFRGRDDRAPRGRDDRGDFRGRDDRAPREDRGSRGDFRGRDDRAPRGRDDRGARGDFRGRDDRAPRGDRPSTGRPGSRDSRPGGPRGARGPAAAGKKRSARSY